MIQVNSFDTTDLNKEGSLVNLKLNKIKVNEFAKLVKELNGIKFDNLENFEISLNSLFQKAINESQFIADYANIVRLTSMIEMADSNLGQLSNLNAIIIKYYRKQVENNEFENNKYKSLESLLKYPLEQIEEDLSKAKKSLLGFIKFMGELFKIELLDLDVIHDCIKRLLLNETDADYLKCLYELLLSVGEIIDTKSNETRMNDYFNTLDVIRNYSTLDSIIHITTTDIIELRQNKWQMKNGKRLSKRVDEETLHNKEITNLNLNGNNQEDKDSQIEQYFRNSIIQNVILDDINKTTPQTNIHDSDSVHLLCTKTRRHKIVGLPALKSGSIKVGRKKIELPKCQDIKMNTAENRYKISINDPKINETERILRSVRSILNRLTPQNFEKLASDLIKLEINSQEDILNATIDILFDKIIDDPKLCETYAKLCQLLSSLKLAVPVVENLRPLNFRLIFLTRCQKEFDSDYYKEINYDELSKAIEECTDEKKKAELIKELEEKLSKAKKRKLGNIRFIGELFKLGMLTEMVMHDCIRRLSGQEADEENLECLCILLTTIGKNMDNPKQEKEMNQHFDVLNGIIEKQKQKVTISSRIRFMILDVIELRQNKWIPRSLHRELQQDEATKRDQTGQRNIKATIGFSKNKQSDGTLRKNITVQAGRLTNISEQSDNKTKRKKKYMHQNLNEDCFSGNLQESLKTEQLETNENTQNSSILIESYENILYNILQDSKLENEQIFDQIENQFNDAECRSKQFVRGLMSAVCRSCLIDSKIDQELFKKLSPILSKYIGRNDELGLEALFALQALDHKLNHQSGFIRVIFDNLYDEDIISEEAFRTWQTTERGDGHKISVLSLTAFFDWLDETEASEN